VNIAFLLLKEPPFRRLVKPVVKALPFSIRTKSFWDAANRPHYIYGVLQAVDQAIIERHTAVSVVEFGVGEGDGLLALEQYAHVVAQETGISIHVYGFDTGTGMPQGTGDYRDHPDVWKASDFQMNSSVLRQQLRRSTTLVLGDVAATVRTQSIAAPIGFMALDLDFYSSTAAALKILLRQDAPHLRRVALYFDDVDAEYNHQFAGELLAIEEFNRDSKEVKIDRWRGIQSGRQIDWWRGSPTGRPFPDADWLR